MKCSWLNRIVSFDTETTGTDESARIVEFGASVWEDGQRVVEWGVLLNPGDLDYADPEVKRAFEINHIDPQTLKDRPTFADVFDLIKHMLEQAPVRVAHNAPFDSRMLRSEFVRAASAGLLPADGAKPSSAHTTLDTLAIDYFLKPGCRSHTLEAVASRWGVSDWQKHRAVGDASASARILLAMDDSLPPDLATVVARQKRAQAEREAYYARKNGTKNA